MASGTVAYTDTTGNKDYLGIIAGQIGRRLKEASDMASDERDFAEKQAELGGTSLSEAGIGKGYFFKRALGSRFGGDKIARTRGRLGAQGPGTSPTGNFKSRFRGGFDYNVTNEISAATAPVTGALATGLRGVEGGLVAVGQSIDGLAVGIGNLARAQEDAARQAILNGAFMQAFLNHMQREGSRRRANREEFGLERRLRGSGGGGGGRGMINVTPPAGAAASSGGAGNFLKSLDTAQTGAKAATNVKGIKAAQTGAKSFKQAFRGSGVSNVFGITKAPRTITKALANKNVLNAVGKSKAGRTIVKAVKKSGLANTAAKGTTAVRSIKGAERLAEAMRLSREADAADAFAKGMANLDMEDALIKRIYGNAGDIPIPKKQAAKGFASLVDGSFDGTTRNTDEALAAWKYLFGEDQYKRLMGGADAPIGRAMKGTFTHKMLRAPGIPKAMATAGKNTMAKTLLKKIPVIAGIAGIIFGIQRALEGDFVGAGLEITSGLLGATGKGAGLSLAIDGYLLGRDMGMMPMAQGGFLTKPTPVVAGEAGAEGFFPLEGARGKKTFQMFGDGILKSQLDNKGDVSALYAMGNKKYFDDMGGWSKFLETFGEIFEKIAGAIGDVLYNIFSNIPILKRFVKKRDTDGGDNNGNPIMGGVPGAGGNLDVGAGGGRLQGLSEEDFKWLAYGISGEAGGGDDMYAVAASILNRYAGGGYGSIEDVIKAPGQYHAYEIGTLRHMPDVAAHFQSGEGQEKIVAALELLKGRGSFKGQSALANRVPGEDPMVDPSGNYYHYGWQGAGKNAQMPAGWSPPTAYEKFIMKSNTSSSNLKGGQSSNTNLLNLFSTASNPNDAASILNGQSGMFSMGSAFTMPTTIVNNYNTVAGGSGSGNDDSFSTGFPSFAQGFIVPYSMDALK